MVFIPKAFRSRRKHSLDWTPVKAAPDAQHNHGSTKFSEAWNVLPALAKIVLNAKGSVTGVHHNLHHIRTQRSSVVALFDEACMHAGKFANGDQIWSEITFRISRGGERKGVEGREGGGSYGRG